MRVHILSIFCIQDRLNVINKNVQHIACRVVYYQVSIGKDVRKSETNFDEKFLSFYGFELYNPRIDKACGFSFNLG